MATSNRSEVIAQKIIDRAERVENDRRDLLSRAARGVLNIETAIARRILKKDSDPKTYPPEIGSLMGHEDKFFDQLGVLKSAIIDKYMQGASVFTAPEAIPTPNMCGFTSNAITEAMREMGVQSKVVYGHQSSGSTTTYHYWTEALLGGISYTIDATYGQFDPRYNDTFLVYPASENPNHGIKEFVEGDIPVYGDFDESTRSVLENNDGLLPLVDYLSEEPQPVRDAYQGLQDSLRETI